MKEVGRKIGGKVQVNIDSGKFENACPIRMSYVLNKVGIPVPARGKYAVVSGNDTKQYMYRVNDMIDFLEITFGKADVKADTPRNQISMARKGSLFLQAAAGQTPAAM